MEERNHEIEEDNIVTETPIEEEIISEIMALNINNSPEITEISTETKKAVGEELRKEIYGLIRSI